MTIHPRHSPVPHLVRRLRLFAMAALAGLGACSTQGAALPGFSVLDSIGYQTVDRFDTAEGGGALRRNRVTGGFDLRMGSGSQGIPIPGLTQVDLVKHFSQNGKTVLYIDGATAGCPRNHLVLLVDGTLHSWHVGDCHATVKLEEIGKTDLRITEKDDPNPNIWFWRGATLNVVGPFKQSAIDAWRDFHVADPGVSSIRASTAETIALPPVLEERDRSEGVSLWKIRTDQP